MANESVFHMHRHCSPDIPLSQKKKPLLLLLEQARRNSLMTLFVST
jgi:hypothetical protein